MKFYGAPTSAWTTDLSAGCKLTRGHAVKVLQVSGNWARGEEPTALRRPARQHAAERLFAGAHNMLTRYWQALVNRLDRPGRRLLLTLPGSLWVTFEYRRPCLVYWHDGVWIHRYRGAKIPHASLGRAAPPDVFTAEARDLLLYGYTPRPGDNVVAVGAGIGRETLLFSQLVGDRGRVVALEAHPRTYLRLASLCRVNGLENVTPLQVAASDRNGTATMSDDEHHLQNTMLTADGIKVLARRLDSLAAELRITPIDLLTMNIEGAERLAIRGLDQIIGSIRNVCISCHDFLADESGSEQLRTKALVRDYLIEHGFAVSGRDDAAEPWTRDYLYGVNTRRLSTDRAV
jgi:FkbM family methyltransferase